MKGVFSNKKKLIAALSATMMVAAMSVPAFAADDLGNNIGENPTIDVTGKYESSLEIPEIYSVDVSWGAMEFTYSVDSSKTWNPEDHTYSESVEKTWTANGNTVTVTNHSNAEVSVGFTYVAEETYADVTGSFDVASDDLAAGVENDYENADSVTATLTLSGELSEDVTAATKVGTVTVTIAEKQVAVKDIPFNAVIQLAVGTLQAEEGMTWGEWVESEYNTKGFSINGQNRVTYNGLITSYSVYTGNVFNKHYVTADEVIAFDNVTYNW